MPVRAKVPRTTHQWLAALYSYLDYGVDVTYPSGASGIPNSAWLGKPVLLAQVGNASGLIGMFGASGVAGQLSTGTAGITAWTGAGASAGLLWFNGGSGAFYTIGDIVATMKNVGLLKQ